MPQLKRRVCVGVVRVRVRVSKLYPWTIESRPHLSNLRVKSNGTRKLRK